MTDREKLVTQLEMLRREAERISGEERDADEPGKARHRRAKHRRDTPQPKGRGASAAASGGAVAGESRRRVRAVAAVSGLFGLSAVAVVPFLFGETNPQAVHGSPAGYTGSPEAGRSSAAAPPPPVSYSSTEHASHSSRTRKPVAYHDAIERSTTEQQSVDTETRTPARPSGDGRTPATTSGEVGEEPTKEPGRQQEPTPTTETDPDTPTSEPTSTSATPTESSTPEPPPEESGEKSCGVGIDLDVAVVDGGVCLLPGEKNE